MCLAQGPQRSAAVRLEPAAPRSRTLPLSHCAPSLDEHARFTTAGKTMQCRMNRAKIRSFHFNDTLGF